MDEMVRWWWDGGKWDEMDDEGWSILISQQTYHLIICLKINRHTIYHLIYQYRLEIIIWMWFMKEKKVRQIRWHGRLWEIVRWDGKWWDRYNENDMLKYLISLSSQGLIGDDERMRSSYETMTHLMEVPLLQPSSHCCIIS